MLSVTESVCALHDVIGGSRTQISISYKTQNNFIIVICFILMQFVSKIYIWTKCYLAKYGIEVSSTCTIVEFHHVFQQQ